MSIIISIWLFYGLLAFDVFLVVCIMLMIKFFSEQEERHDESLQRCQDTARNQAMQLTLQSRKIERLRDEKGEAYRQDNKKIISEKGEAYRQANKKIISEKGEAYRQANKKIISEKVEK